MIKIEILYNGKNKYFLQITRFGIVKSGSRGHVIFRENITFNQASAMKGWLGLCASYKDGGYYFEGISEKKFLGLF